MDPVFNCMTLGKLFNLFVPQIPQLYNKDNSTYTSKVAPRTVLNRKSAK